MLTQKTFWSCMKNLRRNKILAFAFLTLIIGTPCPAVTKEIPLGRNFLNLSDGRWIWLKKVGQESTRTIIGRSSKSEKNAIWSHVYTSEYDHPWDYAYFVYLKSKQLVVDLDHDGNPEVGIATFDYGNSAIRNVMIFSIKGDHLEFERQEGPFNLEADNNLFK